MPALDRPIAVLPQGVLMMSGAPSPVQPVGPFLAAAPKDAVTTSLGAARVWATLGQGIVSEVYWPSTGEPQIRDLGFIVAGDDEPEVTDLRFTGRGPIHLRHDALPERGPHPGRAQRRGHRILRRCREERAHRLHR